MELYKAKAIARVLNLTEKRVKQLRDDGIIKEYSAGSGLYELIPTNHAYINFLRKRGSEAEQAADYNTEKALLLKAKRENEELDLAVKKGELHSAKDVELVRSSMLINFKNRLSSIPAKLAPKLAQKNEETEIFKMLKEATDDALNELADFDVTFGDVIKDEEKDS